MAAVAISTFLGLVIAVCLGQVFAPLSEIKAIVFDETGAVIPDSEIVFRSDSRTVVSHTGMDGSITLRLPSGTYAVTTRKVGFVKSEMLDVQVVAPMPDPLRIILKVDHTPTDGDLVDGVPTAASDLPSKIQPELGLAPSAQPAARRDCSTLKYSRHKVSCLCGTVQICSGDICGRPSTYNLDDDITVELRDKGGTTILDSKKVLAETRERECTTQVGTKISCNTTERTFCFGGKRDGDYQLAFVLFKNGVPQPAIKFPTNYSRKRRKSCDSIYMVEPSCP